MIANIFNALFKFFGYNCCNQKGKIFVLFIYCPNDFDYSTGCLWGSNLSVSFNIGVNGITVANIIVNAILLIIILGILKQEDIFFFSKEKLSFA
jgi:NADH:ubiquinone oxidoreductase subunit 4 (subunit M)